MSRRQDRRGRHEPLVITIRRPRARVTLTRDDGELIMRALADAMTFRQHHASQWCDNCLTAPEGACDEHLYDVDLVAAYGDLSARLAEVLPEPPAAGGAS